MSLLADYIQQFGRFQRNARLFLLSNLLSGVTLGILLVLYNLYLASLGYKTDFIALVLFAGTLGAGIAIFPAGLLIDRIGGKLILIWSSLAIGVMGIGQILFRTPFPLVATGFVVGIAAAFQLVVTAPYLSANSTTAERTHLFSLNIVLTLGATVLGEILGGALPIWIRGIPWLIAPRAPWLEWALASQVEARSYQLAMLFAGIIAIPSLIPYFFMSNDRPPRPVKQSSMQPASSTTTSPEQPLRTPTASLTALTQTVPLATVPLERQPWHRQVAATLASWRVYLRPEKLRATVKSPIVALIVVQVLVATGAGLFIPYFNLFFVQHLRASSALFGLIDGAANGLNALLTLLAPLLAARVGKVASIVFTRLASIPVLLTVGLSGVLPLAAALYPLRQGLMDMSSSIFQVFSMEEIPQERRGLANSSYQAAYQVALALSSTLGGLIIAYAGYTPVFISAALLYLLSITIFWFRFRNT